MHQIHFTSVGPNLSQTLFDRASQSQQRNKKAFLKVLLPI